MSLVLPAELLQLAQHLYSRGLSDSEVTTALQQKGAPDNMLNEVINQVKKIRADKRRNRGFAWCGVGVTLLVLGCMLTFAFTGNHTQMRVVMYGLTTIGVFVTLKGLIDLLGW